MRLHLPIALAAASLATALSGAAPAAPRLTYRPPVPVVHHPFPVESATLLSANDLYLGFGIGLGGTTLQITQTGNGVSLPNGARSFIQFGDALHARGVADRTLDVPVYEVGLGNWGAAIWAFTGGTMTVDRVHFLINDIHTTIDLSTINVTLEDSGAIVLDLDLASSNPTLKGEGNAYLVPLFGIPIGWQDNACPDVSITNMKARIRLFPGVGGDGKVAIPKVTAELLGDIDASPLDHSHDQDIRDAFGSKLADALSAPDLRSALAAGVQALIESKAGKSIPKLNELLVDSTGMFAGYP